MLAATLLSFALGFTGYYLVGSGFVGGILMVCATITNLFAITGYPHLIDGGSTPREVAILALPTVLVSLLFGLAFFSLGWGLAYAMFAMVAYLVCSVESLRQLG